MKSLVSVAAASLALACAQPAAAQTNTEIPQNPRITVRYEPPSLLNTKKYGDIYKRLQSRKVLEQLSQVLSPLRLESDLLISVVECPDNKGPNSDYHPLRKAIRLCYEMLDFIENGAAVPPDKLPAPKNPNITVGLMPGITRGEAIVGGWVGVALHETGHAVFDIQRIPRFGKEEDAADQIAALMMLQFGNDVGHHGQGDLQPLAPLVWRQRRSHPAVIRGRAQHRGAARGELSVHCLWRPARRGAGPCRPLAQ